MTEYITCAIHEAKRSKMGHKHGCVIIYKNKVISKGHNYRVDFYFHQRSIHAEIDAIKKIRKMNIDLGKCILYVVRISNNDSSALMLSKPCTFCTEAILKYGIGKVYYSS
jgi:tRNA(Arg) A34 adenosine deaminase TadA